MANASGRAEAPTAPQPSTLPAARALDELPGSDELGKLQAALAQIKENLERRNLTAAELQGLREQIAPLSDSILAALQRLEPRLAGIKERLDQLGALGFGMDIGRVLSWRAWIRHQVGCP